MIKLEFFLFHGWIYIQFIFIPINLTNFLDNTFMIINDLDLERQLNLALVESFTGNNLVLLNLFHFPKTHF